MSSIVALIGAVIWAFAAQDAIFNGADLLGATITIGGALALTAKYNNKESKDDQ